MHFAELGRFLILAGGVLLVVGIVLLFADKIPLGRLPGDLQFGSGRFRVYIPIATSIVLSVIITLVLNFFARR
jgi:hypothetical protein